MAIEAATEAQIFAMAKEVRELTVALEQQVYNGNSGFSDNTEGWNANATQTAEFNALVTAAKAAVDAVDAAV